MIPRFARAASTRAIVLVILVVYLFLQEIGGMKKIPIAVAANTSKKQSGGAEDRKCYWRQRAFSNQHTGQADITVRGALELGPALAALLLPPKKESRGPLLPLRPRRPLLQRVD